MGWERVSVSEWLEGGKDRDTMAGSRVGRGCSAHLFVRNWSTAAVNFEAEDVLLQSREVPRRLEQWKEESTFGKRPFVMPLR